MNTGKVLIVIGVLLLLGAIANGASNYNFHDTHDISKFAGGIGFSVVLIAIGVSKLKRPPSPPPA